MPWESFAIVAAGGAAGSTLRYWAALSFGANALTTFWVNIIGSFLIGLLLSSAGGSDPRLRLLLATGFLGGFTTFSAWQFEALTSARANQWTTTAAILFGSLSAGFAAVMAGATLGSRIR